MKKPHKIDPATIKSHQAGRKEDMIYDILVTINNSPSKIKKWGYLIKSDSREEAIEKALQYAKDKANKPYSRYKKCTFEVKETDAIARPDW